MLGFLTGPDTVPNSTLRLKDVASSIPISIPFCVRLVEFRSIALPFKDDLSLSKLELASLGLLLLPVTLPISSAVLFPFHWAQASVLLVQERQS